MRSGIGVGGANSGQRRDFADQVQFVVEAERLGVDFVWTAEAWGQDSISPLAFIGARTTRIKLGTGIMQISARAPVMTAMTALTMAAITGDRFVLGLGASGPQVVEGLHGTKFDQPLTRMRETIDIIRLAFAGEKIKYDGSVLKLPLPGGEGKALRLSQPPNTSIPIYLATLGPRTLEFTGAAVEGWLGTSFTPEHGDAHVGPLRKGAASAGRDFAKFDVQVGGTVAIGDDIDRLVQPFKAGLAFTLGAMGSAKTNFYNAAFKRGGWEEAATRVQQLWVAGKRDEAIASVPDEMVIQANLLGTEEMVKARMRMFRDAGVTTLRMAPAGATLDERLNTLGKAMDLLRQVNAEGKG